MRTIESTATNSDNRPLEECVISNCGVLNPGEDDGIPPPQVRVPEFLFTLTTLVNTGTNRMETYGPIGLVS